MKILKHWLFWVILGIIFIPIVLKLAGVIERKFEIQIIPFAWIGLYWFVFFVIMSIKALKDSKKKLVYAYVSVLPLCLSIGEVFLYIKITKEKNQDIIAPHEILGFAPKINASQHEVFKVDDEIVYDVYYNTDENGLRVTTDTNTNYKKCLHFYGGSFTFGNGLDNHQTLPSYLAKALKSQEISVINYGISGGGAHTMLARLEFNLDSYIWDKCRENVVFYIAIPHHIYRTFGVYGGPKYVLKDHKAIYSGKFTQREKDLLWEIGKRDTTIMRRITNQLDKSFIYEIFVDKNIKSSTLLEDIRYHNGYFSNPNLLHLNTTTDLDLYFTILSQILDFLDQKYNTELIVILWDNDMHAEFLDKYDEAIKTFLSNNHIRFYTLSEIIPDYPKDLDRVKNVDLEHFAYRISRWDTHPNALANELIAKFLAHKIQSGEITTHTAHTKEIQ